MWQRSLQNMMSIAFDLSLYHSCCLETGTTQTKNKNFAARGHWRPLISENTTATHNFFDVIPLTKTLAYASLTQRPMSDSFPPNKKAFPNLILKFSFSP